MNQNITQGARRECLALSCLAHVLLAVFFLLDQHNLPLPSTEKQVIFIDSPQQQSQKKQPAVDEEAELIQAPCVLYNPSRQNNAQQKAPAQSQQPAVSANTPLPTSPSPGPEQNISQDKEHKNSQNEMAQKTPAAIEPSAKSDPVQKATITKPEMPTLMAPQIVPAQKDRAVDSTMQLGMGPQEKNPLTEKSDSTGHQDTLRKRKLTLADLFKDLGYATKEAAGAEGNTGEGAPAVIVQGDIKYHSFISSLLEHINATSAFRNGTAVITPLLRDGKIKRNLKMNLTLDKSGAVLDAHILITSGCPELDAFWVETAQQASPFAPLPEHFKRDKVRVELVTQL